MSAASGERATATEPAARRRRKWTCPGCEVVVRNVDDRPISEPKGWWDGVCIRCQIEAAKADPQAHALILLRQGTRLRDIYAATRIDMKELQRMKEVLAEGGEVEVRGPAARSGREQAAPPRRNPRAARREKVEDALRADPTRSNREIADELGVSYNTVVRGRRQLGLANSTVADIAERRRRIADVLRAHPEASNPCIAKRLRVSRKTVQRMREQLEIPQAASVAAG